MKKLILFIFITVIFACNTDDKGNLNVVRQNGRLIVMDPANGLRPQKIEWIGEDELALEEVEDTLKVRFNRNVNGAIFSMFEGLKYPLSKSQDGTSVGSVPIPDLANAIFSFNLIANQKDSLGRYQKTEFRPKQTGENYFRWLGSQQSINYYPAKRLRGKLEQKIISSQYLKKERQLTTYYPKEIDDKTPVFYLTDGSIVNQYAYYLDSLITEGKIKPIILVGVHASDENRYEEYVANFFNRKHFKKHRRFFFKEVIPSIEGNLKEWTGNRYLYGVSNGAAFCLYAGIKYPKLFEEVVGFSTVGYISEPFGSIHVGSKSLPGFYLGAGRYEASTFDNNMAFVEKMKTKHSEVQFKVFISGHDFYVWQIEFLRYLEMNFAAL